jgi:hypothetical protein
MENNRAINPCICTLSIVTIGKVLMRSKIGLKFIVSFVVWLIKMAENDIARLLQNAEFEEILPEERNVHGINVDKQTNTDKMYIALVQI